MQQQEHVSPQERRYPTSLDSTNTMDREPIDLARMSESAELRDLETPPPPCNFVLEENDSFRMLASPLRSPSRPRPEADALPMLNSPPPPRPRVNHTLGPTRLVPFSTTASPPPIQMASSPRQSLCPPAIPPTEGAFRAVLSPPSTPRGVCRLRSNEGAFTAAALPSYLVLQDGLPDGSLHNGEAHAKSVKPKRRQADEFCTCMVCYRNARSRLKDAEHAKVCKPILNSSRSF